jgi:hypothetical protein
MFRTRPRGDEGVRGIVEIQRFSPLPHQPPHSAPPAFGTPGHWRVPLISTFRKTTSEIVPSSRAWIEIPALESWMVMRSKTRSWMSA